MPIIQNFSDKNKLKANIITAIYVLLALTVAGLLINRSFSKDKTTQTPQEKDKKTICLENDIPESTVAKLTDFIESSKSSITSVIDNNCTVVIGRNVQDANNMKKLFDTTYILVQKTQQDEQDESTQLDNISTQELINSLVTQQYGNFKILWDKDTDDFLKSAFSIGVGQIVYPSQEIQRSLEEEENTLAILKSTDRQEWMTVISIDEYSPFKDNFNSTRYPLIDRYWIGGSSISDIDKIYDILVK